MVVTAEIKRSTERRLAAAAATDSATGERVDAQGLPIAADLLDGGEIVLLAIKPSPWFVLFDAARWLLFGLVLLVVAALPSLHVLGMSSRSCTQLACAIILARVGVAFLRWVSRFYVLTNRRVMRVRGVFKADILACPLVNIERTQATAAFHERLTGLGTILFETRDRGDTRATGDSRATGNTRATGDTRAAGDARDVENDRRGGDARDVENDRRGGDARDVSNGWRVAKARDLSNGWRLADGRALADADLNWYEIARCDEVHAQVRRAIERANDRHPRT